MIRPPPRSTLFPSRRSSDLRQHRNVLETIAQRWQTNLDCVEPKQKVLTKPSLRSEEHTSELQSQSNLVCRLLLEKKKKTKRTTNNAIKSPKEPSFTCRTYEN